MTGDLLTAPGEKPAAPAPRPGRRLRLTDPVTGVWLAALAVTLLGWAVVAAQGGQFLTTTNVVAVLQNSVALGLVAVGQSMVILTGSLDLSVAYLISLGTLVAAQTMQSGGVLLAVLATLALSVAVGLANGLIVAGLKVNASSPPSAPPSSCAAGSRISTPARPARSPPASSGSATTGSGPSPSPCSCCSPSRVPPGS